MSTIIEIIIGAIIAIITTIVIEYYRKPQLSFEIESPPIDLSWSEPKPAQKSRFLRLILKNKKLPFLLKWMSRNAALQAHGTITFYHLDGQKIYDRNMKVRWADSPIATPSLVHIEGGSGIVNIGEINLSVHQGGNNETTRRDIYPGESELLDIVVRLDDEEECYGWNDDSYQHNWRNPDWKISKGRYFIKVTILSAGEKVTGIFRLINDVPVKDFRLEPATKDDIRKICH